MNPLSEQTKDKMKTAYILSSYDTKVDSKLFSDIISIALQSYDMEYARLWNMIRDE